MHEISTKSFIYNLVIYLVLFLIVVWSLGGLYDIIMVKASEDSFNDNVEVYVNFESKSISCNMNYKTQMISNQDYYDFCPYVIGLISDKLNLSGAMD